MKSILPALILLPNLGLSQITFWTEDFGTGCNQGQLVGAYSGPNGTWTVTNTGTNAAQANTWYVSAMENGNAEGECGTVCGNDRSLHIGNVFIDAILTQIPADNGASYYEGLSGFCGLLPCGATDKRVESPVINCSNQTSITVHFLYIEGGNLQDNATMWYYNGSVWTQLANMLKTFSGACDPQGIWTAYSVNLPSSADNNANVKIGFRWTNNEDGSAVDPSIAVDDIVITAVSPDSEAPVVECPAIFSVSLDENCSAVVPDLISASVISDNLDPAPVVGQDPVAGMAITSTTVVTITATDAAGNSASCSTTVTVLDDTSPTVICPPDNTFEAPYGTTDVYLDISLPLVDDNCSTPSYSNNFTLTEDASAIYPAGITLVTYSAVDASGNESTCVFAVTVNVSPCCLGDFNCDGVINVSDLLIFISEFGTANGIADLNYDGSTNIADLLLFMGVFGTFC